MVQPCEETTGMRRMSKMMIFLNILKSFVYIFKIEKYFDLTVKQLFFGLFSLMFSDILPFTPFNYPKVVAEKRICQ